MKKISASHIQKAVDIKPMTKNEKTLANLTEETIKKLLDRAEREVPEYGPFKLVYEDFKNPDKNVFATDFMLKISKPQGAENEKLRFLEAVAYDLPKPYISERVIASGEKKDILEVLKKEDLNEKLVQTFRELSKNLEDI